MKPNNRNRRIRNRRGRNEYSLETRKIVEKVLSVNSTSLTITEDRTNNLIAVNSKSKTGELAGVVIDPKLKILISSTPPFPELVISDDIGIFEDKITIPRIGGRMTEHKKEDITFIKGEEGVMIRVFKFEGKVYVTSRTKLDITKSRWLDSRPFLEVYRECGGPEEELFPENCITSPYSYAYMLVYPKILRATRREINSPYVVYIACMKTWESDDYNNCHFKQVKKDGSYFVSEQEYAKDPRPCAGYVGERVEFTKPHYGPLRSSTTLRESEVVTYLQYGDEGLKGNCGGEGEFVIVYIKEESGRVVPVKIYSTSYNFRDRVLNMLLSFKRLFFKLTTCTAFHKDTEHILKHKAYNFNLIKETLASGEIVKDVNENKYMKKGGALTKAEETALKLLQIVPYCRQLDIINGMEHYEEFVKRYVSDTKRYYGSLNNCLSEAKRSKRNKTLEIIVQETSGAVLFSEYSRARKGYDDVIMNSGGFFKKLGFLETKIKHKT